MIHQYLEALYYEYQHTTWLSVDSYIRCAIFWVWNSLFRFFFLQNARRVFVKRLHSLKCLWAGRLGWCEFLFIRYIMTIASFVSLIYRGHCFRYNDNDKMSYLWQTSLLVFLILCRLIHHLLYYCLSFAIETLHIISNHSCNPM